MAGRFPTDGWTEVRRRRGRREYQWDCKLETTFFIENLPEETSNRILWRCFGNVGRLSDAYVARKKDSAGNRFGFLRFLNVKEVNDILERANGVRVLEAVVKVSLARFDRNHKKFNHTMEVQKTRQGSEKAFKPGDMGGVRYDAGRRYQHGGMSYKEALNNQGPESPARKTITLTGEEGLLQKHWQGKAVIGESRDIKGLKEVQNILKVDGLQEVGLSYVGGLKTMITFHDKKQAVEFINNSRQSWGEFFEEVHLWNGEDSPKERLVKLKIRGIPIQLRDDDVYNDIGNYFGKVVGRSEFSWGNLDASEGSCIVLVNQWGKIDEIVKVIWKGRTFEIAVTETEWSPMIGGGTGLEEGEFRWSLPEKVVNGTGGVAGSEGGKTGVEETGFENRVHGKEGNFNKVHGKDGNFNGGGETVNEFIFEGGIETYAQGLDMGRKRKRRRAGKSPLPVQDKSDQGKQSRIGPNQNDVGQGMQTENEPTQND